jgi:Leucine Rich repeat
MPHRQFRQSPRCKSRWPRKWRATRAMMLAVFVAASLMGWIASRARVQREAVSAIHRANGFTWYDWRIVSNGGLSVSQGSPRAPKWLVDSLGVDYFGSVVAASIATGGRPPDGLVARIAQLNRLEELCLHTSLLSDEEMAQIGSLTRLRKFALLGCHLPESGTAQIGRLAQLRALNLQGANVDDAGASHLARLARLERLDLRDTRISDVGLGHLKTLSNLKVLLISGPSFTDAGVGDLQRTLPNLTIVAPDRSDLAIYRNSSWLDQPIPKGARGASPNPENQRSSNVR